jgi:phage-related tail fiber protein
MQLKRKEVGAVGRIEQYASTIPPKGAIKANGAELSRVLFWRLFKHAQDVGNLVDQSLKDVGNYGTGDGLSTFTIPDYRGFFLRGLSDGSTLDEGRILGSYQNSQNKIFNNRHPTFTTLGASGNAVNIQTGWSEIVEGGTDARPENSSVLICIRYQ